MFKSYLKVAFRNLKNQKLFSFINILGLAAGITCTILILLWVQDELSYDTFNKNGKDIYRVVENQFYAGGEIFPVAVTPGPLAQALKDNYPEVINSTRVTSRARILRYGENIYSEELLFADSSFLKIFSFSLIEGNEETALRDPHSILLSQEMAEKYFANENPIGKTILVNDKYNLEVKGVFENVPDNSHLQFNFIVPFLLMKEEGTHIENWGNNTYYTYVQLLPNTDAEIVNNKIKNIIKENNERSITEVYLQPMLDIHLYSGSKFTAEIQGNGNIEYVNVFSLIALFVLLIACINFMNLSTARSAKRSKEVGLRKVVGAGRTQIIKQFFIESILLTLFGFLLSLVFVYLLLPSFNELSGKSIEIFNSSWSIYAGMVVITLFTGIISGSYPAVYLSSFLPARVLKQNNPTGKGGSLFRKVLVITQFSLSIILIVGTTVVYKQLDYIQNKNLGFNKENIVYYNIGEIVKDKIESVKSELLKNPNILSATLSNQTPAYYGNSTSSFDWDGKNKDEKVLMHFVAVDEDYIQTFKMGIERGRFFSKDFVADTGSIVINETAAKVIGFDNPVGKRLTMWGDDLTIIGVVKDFNFKKLDTKIEPLAFRYFDNWSQTLFVRLNSADTKGSLEYIDNLLQETAPSEPVNYSFLDEDFDRLYKSEQRMGGLFTTFSILAVLISCLGLFGLASFMAERRTKEIGIRKVLGASVSNLIFLLSTEFSKWIIISNLIAWPLAYYFMNQWLQDFAYRTEISLWIFPLAGLLALAIALLTVAYQSIKAALSNPIRAIKYE